MPPKAFLAGGDGELRFEFYLADRLRMTVATLRETMSHHEFVQWSRYHAVLAQERELAEARANPGVAP